MPTHTYIIKEHELVSLSSRIASDSGKFADQMRHDHQQYKPDESVHGCDNYLQNNTKKHTRLIVFKAAVQLSLPYIVIETHSR